jgi:ParB family chromosome partitioning protein
MPFSLRLSGWGFLRGESRGLCMELILFDNAKRAVAQLQEFDEVREHLDKAAAVQEYARRAEDRDMEIRAAKYRVYCERRAGEMLQGTPDGKPTNDGRLTSTGAGVHPSQATRYRQLADVPEEDFDTALVELEAEDTPPTRGRIMEKAKPHVSNNSGNNEWYTPPEYIEAAREVMGRIYLDPASSDIANETVKATKFYTAENSGLAEGVVWRGNVWMNPPYSADLIAEFCSKLKTHVDRKHVRQAIVLVNNATETQWFADLIGVASAVCFPRKRVRFLGPEGAVGSPLQGQAIVCIGSGGKAFLQRFKAFGWTASVIQ